MKMAGENGLRRGEEGGSCEEIKDIKGIKGCKEVKDCEELFL